jgi:hypothetical protein
VQQTDALRSSGVVAKIGDVSLTERDLGEAINRSVDADERAHVIRQIAGVKLVDHEAKRAGVTVTAAELDAALAARRQAVEADPRYQGATFERILTAQGSSLAAVRDGAVLRAQVLIDKIVAVRYPRATLRAEFESDPEPHLALHGKTRRVLELLVRGAEGKSRLTRRSYAEAETECRRLAERITGEDTFNMTARLFSEDTRSRNQGGDLGFVHRLQPGLERVITEAAFDLPLSTLSAPLRTQHGYHLVMAVAEQPAPAVDEILQAMGREKADDFLRKIVDEAKLELASF